jgi:hypothetical protein
MVCLLLVSKNEVVGFEFPTAMRMMITALLIGNFLRMVWGQQAPAQHRQQITNKHDFI